MRIISLILAICFSFNVLAGAGTIQEFEKALDNYQYNLSVDWDQKDQNFYNSKTQEFFNQMEQLINTGLTSDEVIQVVSLKSKNNQAVEAIKLKMNLLGGMNSEELAKLIKESSKNLYQEGASWNGYVIFPVVFGLIIAGAIGYAFWWDANHVCTEYENQYVCRTYNNCNYNGGYYDPYNGGYYGNNYCYGTSYTSCGYVDVCVNWEKK